MSENKKTAKKPDRGVAEEGMVKTEGLRERKRRETLQRISEAGMRLFIANGYEATTLDAIAAEAQISRRTFFYYFKSKDDILLSMQGGFEESIAAAIRAEPPGQNPLETALSALLKMAAVYPHEQMIAIDRVMRSSEAVQMRKQANYIEYEKALHSALCERWPEPERRQALRLVAMLSIGAMRLSLEAFNREGGKRPYADMLREAFDTLKTEF